MKTIDIVAPMTESMRRGATENEMIASIAYLTRPENFHLVVPRVRSTFS